MTYVVTEAVSNANTLIVWMYAQWIAFARGPIFW